MIEISREEVLHLAQLSSLLLAENEISELQRDMPNILNYFRQLTELDTEGVEPTYQVTDLQNVWRDDSVGLDGVSREKLLQLSPAILDNQVKVPKVL